MAKRDRRLSLGVGGALFTQPTHGHRGHFAFCVKNLNQYEIVAGSATTEELVEWAVQVVRSTDLKNADANLHIPLPNPRNASRSESSFAEAQRLAVVSNWKTLPEICRRVIKDRGRVGSRLTLEFDTGDERWVFAQQDERLVSAPLRDWAMLANVVIRDIAVLDFPSMADFYFPQAPAAEFDADICERYGVEEILEVSVPPLTTAVYSTAVAELPAAEPVEQIAGHLQKLMQLCDCLEHDATMDVGLLKRLKVLHTLATTTTTALKTQGVEAAVVDVERVAGAEAQATARLNALVQVKRSELDEGFVGLTSRERVLDKRERDLAIREAEIVEEKERLANEREVNRSEMEDCERTRLRLDESKKTLRQRSVELDNREKGIEQLATTAENVAAEIATFAARSAKTAVVKMLGK